MLPKTLTLIFLTSLVVSAQPLNPTLWQSLNWRSIGPFRGGRTVGGTGVRSQPNVFYIGVNNGGVWKTNDYGRTWKPLFDKQPTGSIGDVAVSQSNPNVLYAASGEGLQRPDLSIGDGVYKSIDGGSTWRNMGLRDAQQIASIIVDPADPNRIFAAALGHPYGPNTERGIYRSLNGGETWERVLYKDENTGAMQVEFDPQNPQNIYASLWAGRQGPWENGQWKGAGSGLFHSTDGGTNWTQLTQGLPTIAQGLGRIGIGIAYSNPQIMYATVEADRGLGGIYRSDNAGTTWRLLTADPRLWGRGSDFAEVRAKPNDPETVYVANTGTYVSIDGGKTFKGFKGAPGGDDYHRIWINLTVLKSCYWPLIKGLSSVSMVVKLGAPGTTRPPRSSITCLPTISSPIGCMAASRKAVPPVWPAVAITVPSPGAIGAPSVWKNTATLLQIRLMPTSFTAVS